MDEHVFSTVLRDEAGVVDPEAGVVRQRNAHDVIGRLRSVGDFGFAADEGEIANLAVSPSAWGGGVGRALLGAALKFEGKFILQTKTDGPVRMLVVDFTTPDTVMDHLHWCIDQNINVVVGTSGFTEARYVAEQKKVLLRQQLIKIMDVPGAIDLGQHDHVELVAHRITVGTLLGYELTTRHGAPGLGAPLG